MSTVLIAALLLAAADQPPQDAPSPEAPAAPAQANKVVSYPASYFAQYHPDTAFDMLQKVPAFAFDQGGGQRGFAGAEGNVRLDGQMPTSRSDGMSQILKRMPAAAVERIDVVTGGAEGIDMQGQSVIANIVRKKNLGMRTTVTVTEVINEEREDSPGITVEMQKSDAGHLFDGYGIARHTIYGAGGPRFRGLGTAITESDYENLTVSADARITMAYETPLAGGKARINGVFGQSDVDTNIFDTPTNATLPSAELDNALQQVAEAGGRFSRTFEGTNLEASVYHGFRRNDVDSNFQQGTTQQHFVGINHQTEDILRGLVRLAPRGKWAFDGGAETAYNALDANSLLTINGANIPISNANLEVDELRGEVFATAVWTQSPKFNLQAGLRLEGSNISADGDTDLEKSLYFFKPRLLGTWTPAKGHLVVLRAERTVDQLSFNDFAATANLTNQTLVNGNPDIEPAENLIFETRYEYRFMGRGALTVGFTHRDIQNVVGRTLFDSPKGKIEASANIGDGTRDQLSASLTLPTDFIQLKGGVLKLWYNKRWSSIEDPITRTDRVFSNESPWDWQTSFSQDVPGARWRWGFDTFEQGTSITFLPRETVSIRADVIVSAFLEFKQSPTLSWKLEGLNLTNRLNTYDRVHYNAPRDTGVVDFEDLRLLRKDGGGRGYRISLRKTL